jgi:hypothetical protein
MWLSSKGRCKKSGDHHWEDLAKYGYKPNMKCKFWIIFVSFAFTQKPIWHFDLKD